MFKKIFLCLSLIIFPGIASASTNSLAMVDGRYYDSLEEAIANADSNDTVKLIADVRLDSTININKTVNIDLNGNDITGKSMVFKVNGGVLNVSGSGTIREIEPNYGAIAVIGSTDPSDNNYSMVNVEKDVKLEGWSGIFITHDNSKSYGVVVNLDGDINAINDIGGGTGIGVYVNGNIKHMDNSPVINIGDSSNITSTGNGLYIAGYTTVNIGKANISGDESGIGMKAGKLNIKGATVTSNGVDKTPTEGYNNGIKASGTAVQIESNSGYAGNIKIHIDSGTFRSKNSYAIYEYIGGGTSTQVNSMDISGGTFSGNSEKGVFGLSDSFKNNNGKFISGGKYSSNPSSYLKSGYTVSKDGDFYVVTASSSKLVSGYSVNTNDGNGILKVIATIVIIGVAVVLIYLNRSTILGIFKK